MKYNILYTSDSNYFSHMFTSIYSLLENNKNIKLNIHIIEAKFTKEQYQKIELLFDMYNNASFKIYSIDRLKKIMEEYSIPKWRDTDIANVRLFASEIIDAKRILYIDSDTIIDGSISELFERKLDNPVSAVKELDVPDYLKNSLSKYYNSGILLFDYQLWYEYDCMRLLYENTINNEKKLIFPDQDLLNISLKELIGTLPPRYNVNPNIYNLVKYSKLSEKYIEKHPNFYTMEELKKDYENPCIYHMLQYIQTRPWIKNCIHPFNEIYDKYRIWDKEYEKIQSDSKVTNALANFPLSPLLFTLLQTSFDEDKKVKDKVKSILYKGRSE